MVDDAHIEPYVWSCRCYTMWLQLKETNEVIPAQPNWWWLLLFFLKLTVTHNPDTCNSILFSVFMWQKKECWHKVFVCYLSVTWDDQSRFYQGKGPTLIPSISLHMSHDDRFLWCYQCFSVWIVHFIAYLTTWLHSLTHTHAHNRDLESLISEYKPDSRYLPPVEETKNKIIKLALAYVTITIYSKLMCFP